MTYELMISDHMQPTASIYVVDAQFPIGDMARLLDS
jgi:hypothetical protein